MTTYRLWPSASGGALVSYSSSPFIAAVQFAVKGGGNWLDGYWWWVPAGGDTGAVKCALWSVSIPSGGGGTVVPGSAVTSGTLTADSWNFIPLSVPLQLAPGWDTHDTANGSIYQAQVGWTPANGFPDTGGYWGSGGAGQAGISNGPLLAYSGSSGTANLLPYAAPSQGLFSTASADPAATFAGSTSGTDNFWVDVQVSDTAPAGYTGSYRIWPNKYDANAGTTGDAAVNYTVATEVSLSQACTLNSAWYFSPAAAATLATRADVWRVSDGANVASIASPSWKTQSGAAASAGVSSGAMGQWVSAAFAGGTVLPAGDYRVSVYNSAGHSDAAWSAKDAGTDYWGQTLTGAGSGGISNGPVTAPEYSASSSGYVFGGAGTDTPPWSSGGTASAHAQSVFYEPPATTGAAGFPQLYAVVSTDQTQNYWVDLEVTPVAAVAAGASLSGSGSLSAAALVPAPAALSGAGALAAAASTRPAAGLSGSGSLAAAKAVSVPAGLSGSGSLAAAGTVTAPAPLSGSGTLSPAAGVTGPAAMSGTGSLAAAAVLPAAAALSGSGSVSAAAVLPADTVLSGSGSLGAAGTVSVPGTASLSGTGSLAVAAQAAAPAAMSGSGLLSAAAGMSAPAGLSGTGSLAAAGTVTSPAVLSGSGSLSANAGGNVSGAAALGGSGSLSAAAQVTAAAGLSGSGTLGILAGLTAPVLPAGSGTLTAGAVLTAGTLLSGSGAVSLPAVTVAAPGALDGSGNLAGSPSGSLTGTAALDGNGALLASAGLIPAALLNGSGSLAASAALAAPVLLAGSGSLAAAGSAGSPGAASLAGLGTLAAGWQVTAPAVFSGSGTLAASPGGTVSGAAVLSGTGSLSASGTVPGSGTVAWAAFPCAPRWLAVAAKPRWRTVMTLFSPVSALSLECVNVTWLSDLDGTQIDPTGQTANQPELPVLFAFPVSSGDVRSPSPPVTWYGGSWLLGGTGKGYVAQALVGPGGGVTTLTAGQYDVHAKVSGSPEAPVKFAGVLTVF